MASPREPSQEEDEPIEFEIEGDAAAPAKHPGGRPTKYRPEFVEQAAKLCALGMTDEEIGTFFGVEPVTIWRWKERYPEFCNAITTGGHLADERVERSLYKRAVGYNQPATKIFMPAGATEPVLVPYQEAITPDTTAQIFWLKNRRMKHWRDRREMSGPDGGPIKVEDVTNPTELARRMAFALMRANADPAQIVDATEADGTP